MKVHAHLQVEVGCLGEQCLVGTDRGHQPLDFEPPSPGGAKTARWREPLERRDERTGGVEVTQAHVRLDQVGYRGVVRVVGYGPGDPRLEPEQASHHGGGVAMPEVEQSLPPIGEDLDLDEVESGADGASLGAVVAAGGLAPVSSVDLRHAQQEVGSQERRALDRDEGQPFLGERVRGRPTPSDDLRERPHVESGDEQVRVATLPGGVRGCSGCTGTLCEPPGV